MYWNNPITQYVWPSDQDPIQQSLHGGVHCLFYDHALPKSSIQYSQTLQDLCAWANNQIDFNGIAGFFDNVQNHYDIANLVKLNMWVHDIRRQGVIKPMNLYRHSHLQFGINNGESRLRALERIYHIQHVRAFIGCRKEHAEEFEHLEQIHTFDRFAELCGAIPGQQFLFTLTDPLAPYGIFWYEYNSQSTAPVTPGDAWCMNVLKQYLLCHRDFKFSPEWFDTLVPWADYKSNN